jgi:hypothetical protein
MKRNRRFRWIGVGGLGLMLSVLAAPAAQALTVTTDWHLDITHL